MIRLPIAKDKPSRENCFPAYFFVSGISAVRIASSALLFSDVFVISDVFIVPVILLVPISFLFP